MTSSLNLLGHAPLFGASVSGLEDSTSDSPDNWLATAAPQADQSQLGQTVPTTRNEPHTVEAPPGAAMSGGSLATFLDNAMGWQGTDYDWGGNGYNGRGVDCSGLVYNAAKRAGYNVERWRAKDYGHMGVAVDPAQGRPGDLVYFDNPGDTDHVGIYLGGGKFIESPQRGQKVQVSNLRSGAQLRRVFPGNAPSDLATNAEGNVQYHAPDGQVHTGGPADGPQQDPLDVLSALDSSVEQALQQDPALELGTPKDVVLPGEGDTASSTGSTSQPGGSLGRVLNALSGQESGGDYSVVNSIGAIGKYQVMTANVGTWSRQVLGYSVSPSQFRNSPDIQERVVRGIFGGYVNKYGLRGALAAWYSGDPKRENDYSHVDNGPPVGQYVDEVLARMRG